MTWEKFEEGEEVLLDKDFSNGGPVTVVWQTPEKRMFTRVRDENGEEWEVMTYRLTKIEKHGTNKIQGLHN